MIGAILGGNMAEELTEVYGEWFMVYPGKIKFGCILIVKIRQNLRQISATYRRSKGERWRSKLLEMIVLEKQNRFREARQQHGMERSTYMMHAYCSLQRMRIIARTLLQQMLLSRLLAIHSELNMRPSVGRNVEQVPLNTEWTNRRDTLSTPFSGNASPKSSYFRQPNNHNTNLTIFKSFRFFR